MDASFEPASKSISDLRQRRAQLEEQIAHVFHTRPNLETEDDASLPPETDPSSNLEDADTVNTSEMALQLNQLLDEDELLLQKPATSHPETTNAAEMALEINQLLEEDDESLLKKHELSLRLHQQLEQNKHLLGQLIEKQEITTLTEQLVAAEKEAESLRQRLANSPRITEERDEEEIIRPDPEEDKKSTTEDHHHHYNRHSTGDDSFVDTYAEIHAALHEDSPFKRSGISFYTRDMLQYTIKDHGERAYGICFVELWVVREARLFRPNLAWWMDHDITGETSAELAYPCHLCQLARPERDDYIPAHEVVFGEGLPGVLWSELHGFAARGKQGRLLWRQIKSIALDPLQPSSPRLETLSKCPLGYAAGVAFNVSGIQGLCIWMAHEFADQDGLMDTNNETFLSIATDHIAATYALRLPRELATAARRKHEEKLLAMEHGDVEDNEEVDVEAAPTATSPEKAKVTRSRKKNLCAEISKDAKSFCRKFKGGGLKPPPAFGWGQTAHTFVGSVLTLMAITQLDLYFSNGFLGSTTTLVIGPFGAYVVLLYGLTAAPASQPRSAILGNIIGMSIGMGISKLESMRVDVWLRMSLSSAAANAVMAKFGLIHPPGGALALIFSTGALEWSKVYVQLIGTIIAITIGAIVNNLNPYRQYPTYWGFEELLKLRSSRPKAST